MDFGVSINKRSKVLGNAKITDIIINSLLPFIYAYGELSKNEVLTDKALNVYRSIPAGSNNRITDYMSRLVKYGKSLRGIEQQGLLQIYQDYCRSKQCNDCIIAFRKN
jgi:hypothetical protein